MQQFLASPRELVSSLWRNRSLLSVLVRREVIGRYRGSFMGLVWSFLNPVFMLLIYTFVFSVVLKARWSLENDSKTEFAMVLFSGLLVFNMFAECINRAPSLVLSNANYVKKVVFPLEILPWVSMGSAIFHTSISVSVWLLAYLILFGLPSPTVLMLPVVLIPLVFLTMGLSWLLSSLGVYLRDVAQFIGIVTTVLLFLSPIFYPASALPLEYRALIYLNPLTPVVELTRDVLYWGKAPDWSMWGAYLAASMIVAWAGFAWFQRTRKGFADVL